ncbi:MAG: nitroreductase family protein [Eggerthellaceae bacterium]|jgi:nitroreductase
MSDFMNDILKRRSIRKFTPDEVPEARLRVVLQAGLLAPTSMNKKPCEFYVVRNRALLQHLSRAKERGAAFLADAPVAIAVCADASKSDVWVEDCSIALAYMNLMAADQGLGSCWVQMRRRRSAAGDDAEASVLRMLHAPADFRLVGLLALGIPAQEVASHALDEADFSKVHLVE